MTDSKNEIPLNKQGRTYTSDIVFSLSEIEVFFTKEYALSMAQNKTIIEIATNYEEFMTFLHIWLNDNMSSYVALDTNKNGIITQITLYFYSTKDKFIFDKFIWNELKNLVLVYNPNLINDIKDAINTNIENDKPVDSNPQIAKPRRVSKSDEQN